MDAKILLAAAAALSATLPADAAEVTRARYVMGTVLEITVHADDRDAVQQAISEALDEVQRLDGILSTWKPDSAVSGLNRSAGGAPVPCPPALIELTRLSLHWCRITNGCFSPALHPLITAHGLESTRRTPSPDELAVALESSSTRLIELTDGSMRLRQAGAGLNFGAIGKGYALDRAGAILRFRGVTSARLNFGGQILAIGAPPGATGWPIVIAGSGTTLFIADASAATSSPQQADEPGAPGHIIDPATGTLIDRDEQVTVIAPTATAADALSTACLVLGSAASESICRNLQGVRIIRTTPAPVRR